MVKHTVALLGTLALTMLCGVGCANIQGKINTALEAENVLTVEAQKIESIAQAAIVLLPADKQAAAQADLSKASTAFADAIAAKSATLQAINDGLNSDWTKLAADLQTAATAVEALASLIISFGANPAEVNRSIEHIKTSQGLTAKALAK